MDKKLNRQIGYHRPAALKTGGKKPGISDLKEIAAAIEKKTATKPRPDKPAPKAAVNPVIEATAADVVKWINSHKLFKWGGMCAQLGLDRRKFSPVLKSKAPSIEPEMLAKIVGVLREYGFQG